ncbi:MAG: hypothetical protein WDM76_19875 [Limisphaerales bacterium]
MAAIALWNFCALAQSITYSPLSGTQFSNLWSQAAWIAEGDSMFNTIKLIVPSSSMTNMAGLALNLAYDMASKAKFLKLILNGRS